MLVDTLVTKVVSSNLVRYPCELVSCWSELVDRTFVKTLRVLSRIFRRPFPWLKLDNLKDFFFASVVDAYPWVPHIQCEAVQWLSLLSFRLSESARTVFAQVPVCRTCDLDTWGYPKMLFPEEMAMFGYTMGTTFMDIPTFRCTKDDALES